MCGPDPICGMCGPDPPLGGGVRWRLSNPALMSQRRRGPQPLEYSLLVTATFCLLAGGAVMVYSASSTRTLLQGEGDGTGYLVKYLVYGALGLLVMRFLSRHGLAAVRKLTPLLVLGAFGLCIAVALPGLGVEVNGARRWLGAGPLQFQPSELLKLAVVLHVAAVVGARPRLAAACSCTAVAISSRT